MNLTLKAEHIDTLGKETFEALCKSLLFNEDQFGRKFIGFDMHTNLFVLNFQNTSGIWTLKLDEDEIIIPLEGIKVDWKCLIRTDITILYKDPTSMSRGWRKEKTMRESLSLSFYSVKFDIKWLKEKGLTDES
jgi:hypothetical protein